MMSFSMKPSEMSYIEREGSFKYNTFAKRFIVFAMVGYL